MHYGLEEIQDYLQEQLPEDEAAGLEMHMAACQECAAMARALERRTSEWAGFTAAAHGAMLWRERVERHLQTPAGLFRVVRSAAGDAARFVVESLDAALRIAPLFPMQPAPAPGLATQTSAAAPSGHAVLGKPGGPSVIAEASASELRIRITGVDSSAPAPEVLLIPAEENAPERKAVAAWDNGEWRVRIEKPPSDYAVAILAGASTAPPS